MAEKKTVSVKVYNLAGEEAGKATLSAKVFGVTPNKQAMFDAVQVYQSNARQATAKTKVRHEVRGGGKKPWRQKGTGRARVGSTRSPIWVGGGTVFGPDGTQNYKLAQNRAEHNLALRSALSVKNLEKSLVLVENLKVEGNKTKAFASVLDVVLDAAKVAKKDHVKVLIVTDDLNENLVLSAQNLSSVKLVKTNLVNVYDLLNADVLLTTKEDAKTLQEALA